MIRHTSLGWRRSLPAALLPLFAWALQWHYWTFLQPFVWFLFYPAVFVSSWAGGLLSGVGATMTSIVIVWYAFMVPPMSFAMPTPGNLFSALLFALMGFMFSVAHYRLHVATAQTKEALQASRRSDDARQRSEARFRALIEHGHDSIALIDADNKILYLSPAVTAVEGYRPEELIGRSGLEHTHPDDLPLVQRIVEQLMAHPGQPIPVLWRRQHKDGRWLLLEGFATNLLHDPAVGAIVTNYRDVTERRRADIAVAHLAAIVESSEDAIIGQDLQSVVAIWNLGAEHVFGYTAGDMVGASSTRLIPSDRLHEEAQLLRRIASGECIRQFETVRVRKNGQLIDVSITLSAIRDASQQIVGASKIIRDITAAKVAEQEVRDLNRDLEQRVSTRTAELATAKERAEAADRLKSEFLANMSHELRTPLNAIIGFSDLMYKGKAGPLLPDQTEYLGDILTSAKHLLALINDVLDLAKVESGRMVFRTESIDLARLADESCASLRALVATKRIRLNVHVDPLMPRVVGDAGRITQVLYNYLSNAIKFTPEDGRIELRITPEGTAWFRIDVIDTGIGISTAQQHKLFTRFSQLDASATKSHQGTGLGLVLTKRLVESHGGTVAVTSEPGRGSTFSAMLPCEMTTSPPGQGTRPVDGAARTPTILIVDDDAAMLKLANLALLEMGYRPVCVDNARGGLLAAQADMPAVVVVDLVMPHVDGFEFITRLRAMPDGDRPIVIVWTIKDLDAAELRRIPSEALVISKRQGGTAALVEALEQILPAPCWPRV
jgi:PAS domain S-box-containing protein